MNDGPGTRSKRTTRTAAVLLLALAAAPAAASQQIIHTLDGDLLGDRMGWAVSGAGDVNMDGVPDVVAGAPRNDNNGTSAGQVRVWSGATGAVLFSRLGDAAGDQFGRSVSGAGNIGAIPDGHDDIIAGAPLNDDNGSAAGLARVHSGNGGGGIFTWRGDAAGDSFGASVSCAGDVNNDGTPDLIVGAPQDNTPSNGYARIFSGSDGSVIRTLTGFEAQSQFGISVDGVGDLDGDGFGEVVVGAWLENGEGSTRGCAYILAGVDGTVMYCFEGEQDFDWFGFSVAGAGDVDDDGVPDIVVGAYGAEGGASDSGRAFVYSGADGSNLMVLDGETAGESFGWSVDGAGDTNGDGHDDVVVAAPFDGIGRLAIYSGADKSKLRAVAGDDAGDTFARGVAGTGDMNGDGHGDVVAGAPLDDDNGTSAGRVFVASGFEPWTDLENGLAGTHGIPGLLGTGTLIGGTPVNLALTNALESTTTFLVVGVLQVDAPFKGGTLVPDPNPPGFFVALPTRATGTLDVGGTWPAGLPAGLETFYQHWVQDAGGPQGFSASNALRGITP